MQAVGAATDHLEIGASRLADAVLLVLHHLEEAGDRGQRRTQLVRDGRNERVAHPVELAVGCYLPQCPDATGEIPLRIEHGRRVAAETATGSGELELVARLRVH